MPFFVVIAVAAAISASEHQTWRARIRARIVLLNHLPLLLPLLAWTPVVALAQVARPSFGLISGKPGWIDAPWISISGSLWAGLGLVVLYALSLALCFRKVHRMPGPIRPEEARQLPVDPEMRKHLASARRIGWPVVAIGSLLTALMGLGPPGRGALYVIGASTVATLFGVLLLIFSYHGRRRPSREEP
jgi:hypothetical protein